MKVNVQWMIWPFTPGVIGFFLQMRYICLQAARKRLRADKSKDPSSRRVVEKSIGKLVISTASDYKQVSHHPFPHDTWLKAHHISI